MYCINWKEHKFYIEFKMKIIKCWIAKLYIIDIHFELPLFYILSTINIHFKLYMGRDGSLNFDYAYCLTSQWIMYRKSTAYMLINRLSYIGIRKV